MLAGRKIRLYPTEEQVEIFKRYCGAARFVYNACLAEKIRAYQEDGISLGKFDLIKYAQYLKYFDGCSWLNEISSSVVRIAAMDVDNAYSLFFKRGNKGFPKFKKKGKCREGFGLKAEPSHCKFLDSTHLKFSKINEAA